MQVDLQSVLQRVTAYATNAISWKQLPQNLFYFRAVETGQACQAMTWLVLEVASYKESEKYYFFVSIFILVTILLIYVLNSSS